MSKSSGERATLKLNLKLLRREVERSAAATVKVESTLNSASTSESNSEDDYSDTCDSDGLDPQAGESIGSSRATPEPEPTHLRPTNENGLKPLQPRTCSLAPLKKDRSPGGFNLVASNDFFTPRPNLPGPPTSTEVPRPFFSFDGGAGTHSFGQDMVSRRNRSVDPHPDSLRGRYAVQLTTPRELRAFDASNARMPLGTSVLMTPRDARNSSVGSVFKERVNNLTRKIQQSYNTERRVCRTGKSVSARDLELQLLEHGITPIYQPEICATQPPPKAIADTSDVRSFLSRAAPEGCAPIQCHVQRHFKADWISPRFKLYLQEGNQMHFLLSARKRKKSMSSNYILSLDEDDISRRTGNYFGKLRSNFFGTEFWFYDKGARPKLGRAEASLNRRMELGAVTYQSNPLGFKGPRKMTAIIPAMDDEGKPYIHEPGPTGAHSLLTKYKSGQDLHKMLVLQNKKPTWNEKKMCYALNFNGRVTRPSVKNFQLLKDGDQGNIVLQFGKVGNDAYSMDYKYPMSALQAFATALTSVDKKMACE